MKAARNEREASVYMLPSCTGFCAQGKRECMTRKACQLPEGTARSWLWAERCIYALALIAGFAAMKGVFS